MGLSAKAEETVKRDIAPAGAQEQGIMDLLAQMAQGAGGQMGDLSDLAAGRIGGPTAADQQLVEQSIGASTDIALRELERTIQQIMAQQSGQLAARGLQGSSIEAVGAGQIGSRGVDQIANLLSQQQQQGAQALMNLPFQRAQTQIGANQALLQRLTGTAGPALQASLQERLNTMTQTATGSESPSLMDYFKTGARTAVEVGKIGADPTGGGGNVAT
jgi:hypothetical protein